MARKKLETRAAAEMIWNDRKRHLRLPLSFTRYSLSEDRLFVETGFLNLKEEEILLYRIRDITLTRSLGQRLLGEGTVIVSSSDTTTPQVKLVNILQPREVKELLGEKVEDAKNRRRIRPTELIDDREADEDGDGIPDYLESEESYEH